MLEHEEGMTNEDFTAYIKSITTLEERIAYVKEIKDRFKKEDLERNQRRFTNQSKDDFIISDKWVNFKKEAGVNCFYDYDVLVFVSLVTDSPPYSQNPTKTQIGRYDISITDEDLIKETIKQLSLYNKHQSSEFGIVYTVKKEVKNKPKTTLF